MKTWRPGQGKSTAVLEDYGEFEHKGRRYRFVKIKTGGGLIYNSLRLYNAGGHFIKSFMFETEATGSIINLLKRGKSK